MALLQFLIHCWRPIISRMLQHFSDTVLLPEQLFGRSFSLVYQIRKNTEACSVHHCRLASCAIQCFNWVAVLRHLYMKVIPCGKLPHTSRSLHRPGSLHQERTVPFPQCWLRPRISHFSPPTMQLPTPSSSHWHPWVLTSHRGTELVLVPLSTTSGIQSHLLPSFPGLYLCSSVALVFFLIKLTHPKYSAPFSRCWNYLLSLW